MFKRFVHSCVMVAFFASPALAHGVWVNVRNDNMQIVLGERTDDEAYAAEKVKSVKGYDADFKEAKVEVAPQEGHVNLVPEENVSVIAVDFDSGFWSKTPEGKWVNKPMDEVPGATEGSNPLKYGVAYIGSVNGKPVAIPGLPMQLVPSEDPTKLKQGDKLTVQLLKDGTPMADTDVIVDVVGDLGRTVKTDANGNAVVEIRNDGHNVIGMEIAVPREEGLDKATRNGYFCTLSFVSAEK